MILSCLPPPSTLVFCQPWVTLRRGWLGGGGCPGHRRDRGAAFPRVLIVSCAPCQAGQDRK